MNEPGRCRRCGAIKILRWGEWVCVVCPGKVETSYGGGELERYAEEIGVEEDRLRHYRAVAGAYEVGARTPDLTFSHFERIASRPDRRDWLDLAAKGKWTARQGPR